MTTAYIKGHRDEVADRMEAWRNDAASNDAIYDKTKEIEFQTDKASVKVVPCVECGAPIAANVFYAPAIAKCAEHGGGEKRQQRDKASAPGSQGIVQPGRTDPEKASNLSDCLINKEFETIDCVFCKTPMELKNVTHNPNYGPRHIEGYKGDVPIYKQQIGESALLQCNSCKFVIGMSTTHTIVYRRQNEPKPGTGRQSGWVELLGPREEEVA